MQAAEQAEKLEKTLQNLIESVGREKESNGEVPVIVLHTSNTRICMGSCWVSPNDSPMTAKNKSRRLHLEPLLHAIKSLSFNEFERFGGRVLSEIGASTVRVTPHAEDQGIDFYGVLSISAFGETPPPFLKLAQDIEMRFAGQAKHYPNSSIGPNMLRELVGAISLARYQAFSREVDIFNDLQLRAFNPLLAIIFTTGRFTSGAVRLANKAGIIARSGEQLAVFLADRGVGFDSNEQGPKFNSEHFRSWLFRD